MIGQVFLFYKLANIKLKPFAQFVCARHNINQMHLFMMHKYEHCLSSICSRNVDNKFRLIGTWLVSPPATFFIYFRKTLVFQEKILRFWHKDLLYFLYEITCFFT